MDRAARLAVVGSPDDVAWDLGAFADSGVTDFAAHVWGKTSTDAECTWGLSARAAAG